MNKKSLCIQLTCLVIGLFFATVSFAQDTETQKKNWLLGVVFKLEKMRDDAVVKIRNADTQIRNAENMIRKAEKLIKLSIEEGDSEAEGIARQALATARNAKAKAQEIKTIAELRKLRVEKSIARVRNLLAKEVPVPWPRPNDLKKSPVISVEDSPLIRLPKFPEVPEWVRKEAEKIPSKMGELVITAVGGGGYLKVLKIGVHLKDEAIRQMEKFMDLARRGFPEDEVSAFESEQQLRPFAIVTKDLTGFSATAHWEDGTVEENEAQSWFKKLFPK